MRRTASIILCMSLAAGLASIPAPTASAQQVDVSEVQAKRENAAKLLRPVTITLDDQRLEDVMSFVQELTGAEIEVMWVSDRQPDGLDRETRISTSVKNATALKLIERVLERAQIDTFGGGNSWQFSDTGALQIGPKERLNRYRRVEIYDINDLLLEVPTYDQAPEFDLSQVLQQAGGGGGGGGQSPFQNEQDDNVDRVPRAERALEVQELITELVEPEQWIDNGGDAATIRYWQGSLIVNAPDYVHRQIIGYSWWPRSARTSSAAGKTVQRRYVTIGGSFEHATVDGFAEIPVTGIVGGGTPPPPGGGG